MTWDDFLKQEASKQYYQEMMLELDFLYNKKVIYPPRDSIFKALEYTSYSNTKVVIIGQDPYHNPNQANGLAFSVNQNIKFPPSLRNIFNELEADLNIKRDNPDLSSWAKQGVLLLNKILTVEENKPSSHKDIGWDIFTDEIIKVLNERSEPIIFVLWGNFAKNLKKFITNENHYIIESAHPSPLSAYRGFFGSKPFSKINDLLITLNKSVIDWSN